MSKKQTVAVLGAGNMGTSIANVVASNGYEVNLWNYEGDPEPLKQIAEFGENKKYLAGIKLSKNIKPIQDLAEAVKGSNIVFFVVPSSFITEIVKRAAVHLSKTVICVDASKGMDEKSLEIIPNIITASLPANLKKKVATISGPAIAIDMVKGGFTAMNIASKNSKSITAVKKVLENKNLKLIPTDDIIGVEVTGSFKNVYAIAMGLCDGFALPMNTKAALLVIALKEISVLVKKMGGRFETVYDLAGLGDLVGTGLCATSRNRRFGEFIAQGLRKAEAVSKVGQVVEGIKAGKTLYDLNKKYKIKSPFAEMVYKIISGTVSPKDTFEKFLQNI